MGSKAMRLKLRVTLILITLAVLAASSLAADQPIPNLWPGRTGGAISTSCHAQVTSTFRAALGFVPLKISTFITDPPNVSFVAETPSGYAYLNFFNNTCNDSSW